MVARHPNIGYLTEHGCGKTIAAGKRVYYIQANTVDFVKIVGEDSIQWDCGRQIAWLHLCEECTVEKGYIW